MQHGCAMLWWWIEAAFALHNFILEHEDNGGESEDVYCDDVTTDADRGLF